MPWNPFDWTAVPFLTLYLALAAILFLRGFRLKSLIGPAVLPRQQLSLLELACLAGGERRLGDAVLLGLASANGATITGKSNRITVTSQAPLAALMDRPPALLIRPEMTRRQFQTAVKPIFERVVDRLQAFGYYPTDEQMTTFRISVLPFVGLLLGFGILKVMVGTARQHPVEILLILLVFTTFAGVELAKRPIRTLAGEDALQRYQASHSRVARAPLDHELLLAVALSGTVVLSGTAYASVYAASSTTNAGSSGGGCGSSGCGGGGGGGCGGCS